MVTEQQVRDALQWVIHPELEKNLVELDIELRKGGDKGVPLMIERPDSIKGKAFQEIAAKVAAGIDEPV